MSPVSRFVLSRLTRKDWDKPIHYLSRNITRGCAPPFYLLQSIIHNQRLEEGRTPFTRIRCCAVWSPPTRRRSKSRLELFRTFYITRKRYIRKRGFIVRGCCRTSQRWAQVDIDGNLRESLEGSCPRSRAPFPEFF